MDAGNAGNALGVVNETNKGSSINSTNKVIVLI